MQSIYPWLVFVHVAGAFLFVLAHGVSAFTAFRVRQERDTGRLALLLDMSSQATGIAYSGLALLLLSGIAAGVVGGWFAQRWIWAALGLLVAVTLVMFAVASPYYSRVRARLGLPVYGRPTEAPPISADELSALLDSRRPEGLAAIGLAGLGLLVWLMVFKPF